MTIGVVIVSFNTRELLRACLNSLRGCTVPLRIIVVDNASADGSAALVTTEFPDVTLLALTENLGFAAGTNVGLTHLLHQEQGAGGTRGWGDAGLGGRGAGGTRGWGDAAQGFQQMFGAVAPERAPASGPPSEHSERAPERAQRALPLAPPSEHSEQAPARAPASGPILLLNPDTIVQPGAIEALAAFLAAHPRVGLVAPRLLNPDGTYQAAAFRFPTLSMTALDLFPPGEVLPGRLYNSWWHGRYPQERAAAAPFAIDHPLGACMLVRPEVIAEVGLFDTGYFMYAEEVDWCRRIRAAGWAIYQEPRARVVHVGGASTSQYRGKMLVALYRSRLRYFAAYERPLTVALHRALIRAGLLRWTLLAWLAFARGRLDRAALLARLDSYGQIARL